MNINDYLAETLVILREINADEATVNFEASEWKMKIVITKKTVSK